MGDHMGGGLRGLRGHEEGEAWLYLCPFFPPWGARPCYAASLYGWLLLVLFIVVLSQHDGEGGM